MLPGNPGVQGGEYAMELHKSRLLCILLNLCAVVSLSGQTNNPASKQTLYYVPHTHWEGAVFKTREEYLEMGLPNILKALALRRTFLKVTIGFDVGFRIKLVFRSSLIFLVHFYTAL